MAVRVADKIKQMNDADFFLMDAEDVEIDGKPLTEKVSEMDTASDEHTSDKNNPHETDKTKIGLGNVDNVKQASKTEFDAHKNNQQNPHGVNKEQLELGNVDNTADSQKNVLSATKLTTARKINGVSFDGSKDITIADDTKIPVSEKGASGGVAELDENGKVPAAQLPSYVDDIIEGTFATFPNPGESGKVYVDTVTNLTYRWSGTTYAEISQSLALGETSTTAYSGSKGKKNAEDIASLKERMTTAENEKASTEYVNEELDKKVNQETYNSEMQLKADLSGGIVPDKQLPYYNKTQNVYVSGVLLYPTAFVDVNEKGEVYLREDGQGEYLLYIPLDGNPRIRYMGNAVIDDVTGISYSFTISNGNAVLKQII